MSQRAVSSPRAIGRGMPAVRLLTDAAAIGGGMNIVVPPIFAKPGTARLAYSYEYSSNGGIERIGGIEPYDGHVTLYMADRYHDDAIMFEPRYAIRQPDGGWGEFASDLEIVPIGGEHIQAIDEPYIAKVGAHMSEAINRIQAENEQK